MITLCRYFLTQKDGTQNQVNAEEYQNWLRNDIAKYFDPDHPDSDSEYIESDYTFSKEDKK